MLELVLAFIIAFFSMFIPGLLLSLALLRKTELHMFEIIVIGFIFGLMAPAIMTWLESYLASSIHAFSFSLWLFELNALILTIIGAILCWREGVFKELAPAVSSMIMGKPKVSSETSSSEISEHHEHAHHANKHAKVQWWIWAILLGLMLITFYTRIQSIVVAPKFFEFDPYFDMIDTHYILTYGHQLLLDPAAWPVVTAGTNHRIEPIVPYLEAYWYSLVNVLKYHHTTFSTSLMAYIGGVYPPITAALLVFVIFLLLYHEYDEKVGLIGAALAATMPVLFTTFIAGEQLVEPWGILTLFFFFATYMLAIRNMKDKRLAILAGIAFASTFLGAHYYTVTTGVLVLYIIAQGIIDIIRKENLRDFYVMNAIVIGTIVVFFVLFYPYQATVQSNLPTILHIPITIAGPIFALLLILILDYIPKLLASRKILIKEAGLKESIGFMALITVILLIIIFFTSIGAPIKSYIEFSKRFTTASKPLFMTVQEYIPTGLLYPFGNQGFGAIGAGAFGIPYLVWIISGLGIVLILISIIFRRSKTGVLYIAAAVPLMVAGFLEVKYLPHFGAAYIMIFGIILGEMLYLVQDNMKLVMKPKSATDESTHYSLNVYRDHPLASQIIILVGLFFIFGFILAIAGIIFLLVYRYGIKQSKEKYNQSLIVACVLLALFSFTSHAFFYGESGAILQALSGQYTYLTNPTNACTIMSNNGNSLGYNLYCNTIPVYWLNAMSWIRGNVGPNAPRVLAWWDYGDWINWFGNSNAVLRGDNSVASEDYAVAAQYVLGPKYNATPKTLASYMNGNQTKYVLFDQDLISKWGALDFLGCINVNATSQAYAVAQGQSSNPPVPYALGTSNCEVSHDPEFALVPLSALAPGSNQSQQSINDYCSISSSKSTYIQSYLVIGNNLANNTVCISGTPSSTGALSLYNSNGTKLNAVIQSTNYLGVQNVQGSLYVEFLVIYLPNAANGTITNAPSEFYNSNYYKGFILGQLPGFTQVYPANAVGINFVNGTYPVRIFEVNNYTGGNAPVPPKPSWITNNDTMP